MTSMAAVDGVLEQANGFHERDLGVQLPDVEPLVTPGQDPA